MRLDIVLDWEGVVVEDSWGHWGHRGHGGRRWAGEVRMMGELHGQHPLTPDMGGLVAHRVPEGRGGEGGIVTLAWRYPSSKMEQRRDSIR